MQKKTCSACCLEKELKDFARNKKKSDGLQTWCRSCSSKSSKSRYLNPDVKLKVRERASERVQVAREWVLNFLAEHPCVDCGEDDPIVLQFDHVRSKKTAAIAVAVHDGWSIERIRSEVSKCEVRCANCHLRKTAKDGLWYRYRKAM